MRSSLYIGQMRGTSVRARFAGLGMATMLAVALGAAPTKALAEEMGGTATQDGVSLREAALDERAEGVAATADETASADVPTSADDSQATSEATGSLAGTACEAGLAEQGGDTASKGDGLADTADAMGQASAAQGGLVAEDMQVSDGSAAQVGEAIAATAPDGQADDEATTDATASCEAHSSAGEATGNACGEGSASVQAEEMASTSQGRDAGTAATGVADSPAAAADGAGAVSRTESALAQGAAATAVPSAKVSTPAAPVAAASAAASATASAPAATAAKQDTAASAQPAENKAAATRTLRSSADGQAAPVEEVDPLANWKAGRWVVRSNGERFWVGEDGTTYKGGLVDPTWGKGKKKAGYWAYAKPDGSIVRGVYDAGKWVYLANSKGKLMGGGAGGWVVTSLYSSDKALHRYYIDPTRHAAREGYHAKEGSVWAHYTLPGKGYVLTAGSKKVGSKVYLADGDGKLASGKGWKTTSKYTPGKKQRYYFAGDYAKAGLFTVGKYHYYGTSKGYVVRGVAKKGKGYLVADKKGRLRWKKGWCVSKKYSGGVLQRYYFDNSPGKGLIGAHAGFFKAKINGKKKTFYGTSKGYVLRNDYIKRNGTYYQADNEGRLKKSIPHYLKKVNGESSPTGYIIGVDNGRSRVYVFTGSKGNWKLQKEFLCSAGAPGTPTVRGRYSIGERGDSFGHGYTCYYWTQIYEDYLFHSILYHEGTYNQLDGTLGRNVSHGCVRLAYANARYIHDTIPRGTTVISY